MGESATPKPCTGLVSTGIFGGKKPFPRLASLSREHPRSAEYARFRLQNCLSSQKMAFFPLKALRRNKFGQYPKFTLLPHLKHFYNSNRFEQHHSVFHLAHPLPHRHLAPPPAPQLPRRARQPPALAAGRH